MNLIVMVTFYCSSLWNFLFIMKIHPHLPPPRYLKNIFLSILRLIFSSQNIASSFDSYSVKCHLVWFSLLFSQPSKFFLDSVCHLPQWLRLPSLGPLTNLINMLAKPSFNSQANMLKVSRESSFFMHWNLNEPMEKMRETCV